MTPDFEQALERFIKEKEQKAYNRGFKDARKQLTEEIRRDLQNERKQDIHSLAGISEKVHGIVNKEDR